MTKRATFEVRSSRLNVADPLYIAERAGGVYDLPARNGTWRVEVILGEFARWGQRVMELICRHESVADSDRIDELISNEIDVDAATVCVYETAEDIEDAHESESALVVGPHGACSTSGIGDGTYTAFGRWQNGVLIAVRVMYIPDAQGRFPSDWDQILKRS